MVVQVCVVQSLMRVEEGLRVRWFPKSSRCPVGGDAAEGICV